MRNNKKETQYLVDTNVLINFSIWKPIRFQLNRFFWDELSSKLSQRKWILLDVVVNEIMYDDELKEWCKEQMAKGLVVQIDDSIRDKGSGINDQYEMIDQIGGKSTVDTYLIAYANENRLGIFTREKYRENDTKPYKIPDVCDIFKIKRLYQPKVFLERIGFN